MRTDTATSTRVRPIDIAWIAAALTVPVIVALAAPLSTVDLAYHLRLGAEIVEERTIPTVDSFTFTQAGVRWLDQQWGAQIVLYGVHRAGGWPALVALRAVVVGISLFLVRLTCRALGASIRTASVLALTSFVVASVSLELRPQLLALPLVCLVLWILVTRDSCHRLLVLPVSAWVCATIHGAFLVLLLLVVMATFESWWRRSCDRWLLLSAALSSVAVTFVTPLGVDLWKSALGTTTDPVLRDLVAEWRPSSLDSPEGWLLVLSVVGVAILLWRSPRLWPCLLPAVPFPLLAFTVRRGLLWWAVVAPIALVPLVRERDDQPLPQRESRIPALLMVSALLLVVVVVEPFHRSPYDGLLADAPRALATAVDELPPRSRVLAFQPWASWLEFEAPSALQFIDSRLLVTEQLIDDYSARRTGRAG